MAKRKRNLDQAYTSGFTKQHVAALQHWSRRNDGCFKKLTRPVTEVIFKEFCGIGNFDLQNAFIQRLVEQMPDRRRLKPQDAPNHGVQYAPPPTNYTLIHSNTPILICKKAFLSVLGTTKARTATALTRTGTSNSNTGPTRKTSIGQEDYRPAN